MNRPASLLVLLIGGFTACGGKTADDAFADGGIDAASPTGRPPPATGGATRWFAVQAFHFGISDAATGVSSPDAWKDLGFDLDGRTTTAEDSKTSNNSCTRRPGSPTTILADGNGGIDNSFGGHVMQTIHSLKGDAASSANAAFASGATTLLLRLDNFGPDDNGSVPGALYIAGALGRPPTFSESDVWPVTTDSLLDGATIGKPRFAFPDGYMKGGYWVNGEFGKVNGEVPLPLFGGLVPVALQSATISFDTHGVGVSMIGGAADVSFMRTALTPGAMAFGICPGNATYDQVIDTLIQSGDLVLGAPRLQDTTKECDAISIGFGFVARPTGAPTAVAAPLTMPDGCRSGA